MAGRALTTCFPTAMLNSLARLTAHIKPRSSTNAVACQARSISRRTCGI
jgi:hypothetical protein